MLGSFLFTAIAFLFTLGLLVSFHEFGHFWVARKLGVKVLKFSVGFGQTLWKKTGKIDGTEFVIAAIPLGGFVKMLDEREGEVAANELHRAFNTQPVWKRAAIVSAGPVFNFILAIVLLTVMFILGSNEIKPILGSVDATTVAGKAGFSEADEILSVNDKATPTWGEFRMALVSTAMQSNPVAHIDVMDKQQQQVQRQLPLPPGFLTDDSGQTLETLGLQLWSPAAIISAVVAGGAAEDAGILAGDKVLSVDQQVINNWYEFTAYVRQRGQQKISLEILRSSETITLGVTPRAHPDDAKIGFIGAQVEPDYRLWTQVSYAPHQAFLNALQQTWDMSLLYFRVVGKLITGEASLRNVSGPITIAQYAGQSASLGIDRFLRYLALISISLAVLNLLPIPVLDGGHLLFLVVEAVIRRPVPEKVQAIGLQLGVVLLVALMGLAFYNDILRLIG